MKNRCYWIIICFVLINCSRKANIDIEKIAEIEIETLSVQEIITEKATETISTQ